MTATRNLASLVLVALAFAGCSSTGTGASNTGGGTATAAGGTASGTASTAAKVTIYYEENAQVEIIGPTGRRVLVDVWNPSALSAPTTANDVLLTTHAHGDHYVQTFIDSFPGKKLTWEPGTIKLDDASVTSIPSAHDEGTAIAPLGANNYLYVIDIGGIRITHFGDIGQAELQPDQLDTIGQTDIAISQLSNPFSTMDETNKKGFNLMAQVKPRLIIPTHLSGATAQLASTTWHATFSANPSISFTKAQLPTATTIVFMGTSASSYGTILNLTESAW
jgi:L-ascorbate metabolism protein UlaG (beta-lactamase superfamily)